MSLTRATYSTCKILRLLLKVLGALGSLVLVAVFTMMLRLSFAPLPVNFLIPTMENALGQLWPQISVKIKEVDLLWKDSTFGVHATAVRGYVKDKEVFSLKAVDIRYAPLDLLRGSIVPKGFSMKQPVFSFVKDKEGHITFASEVLDKENDVPETIPPQEVVDTIFSVQKYLRPLEKFSFEKGTIVLQDDPKGVSLVFDDVSCNVLQDNRGVHLSGQLKTSKDYRLVFASVLVPQNDRMEFVVEGTLSNFNFDDLGHFWPETLGALPRKWVLENLSGGKVPQASIALGATLFKDKEPTTNQHFVLSHLEGEIHLNNMKVNYLEGFPAVERVNGLARYTHQTFDIDLYGGTVKETELQSGHVLITGMDKEDQQIKLDLKIKGPLKNALDIISLPPLNFDQKFGFDGKQALGVAQTNLKFDFPLETSLNLDQVQIQVKGEAQDVGLEFVMGNQNLQLSEGKIDLNIDSKALRIAGEGQLNSVKGHFEWIENFMGDQKGISQYKVKSTLLGRNLKKFGLVPLWEGAATVNLDVLQSSKGTSKMTVKIDLDKSALMKLPYLGVVKDKGALGQGKMILHFDKKGLRRISSFGLKGENLHCEGYLNFSKETGQLSAFSFPVLKYGATSASLEGKQEEKTKTLNIRLWGKSLDASSVLETTLDDGANRETSSNEVPALKAQFDLEKLILGEERLVRHVKGVVGYHPEEGLGELLVEGELSPYQKKSGSVALRKDISEGKNRFRLRTNNGGDLIKVLGFHSRFKGGDLLLEATQEEGRIWHGQILFKDAVVENAPILARLLTLSSPFGLMDVLTHGDTLSFDFIRGQFRYRDHLISLQEGVARGLSLGITASGDINLKHKGMKISGSLIPANLINDVLGHIPIISELLGGKDGGLFGVSYTIKGPYKDPKISVNPLSVFAPGVFRQIFEEKGNSDLLDEASETQNEVPSSKKKMQGEAEGQSDKSATSP